MYNNEIPTIVKDKFFSRGTYILFSVMLVGTAAYVYRLIVGLGQATNLDNQYPWGIWIAVDVASGVALAAGGFTTAALVDIFHKEKYHILIRPALLTAMLGYTFVVVGLLADLGRYYNVWHPMIPSMWQGNSVLFEVGICVIIYLTVLYIEFIPIIAERFRRKISLPGILSHFNKLLDAFLEISNKTLSKVLSFFILAGVVLSCLHQSSLGTLMVIAPTKMHPLWYSPILPALFLLSAIAVGFPMVIFESILASWSFKLKPELKALSSISKYTPILLSIYFAVKIGDLVIRDAIQYIAEMSFQSNMFIIEIVLGVIAPIIILAVRKNRQSIRYLLIAASLVIFGIVINRINVFLVAYKPLYADHHYFPSIVEIAVTIGLVAALILVYRILVITFPVISVQTNEQDLKENPMVESQRIEG